MKTRPKTKLTPRKSRKPLTRAQENAVTKQMTRTVPKGEAAYVSIGERLEKAWRDHPEYDYEIVTRSFEPVAHRILVLSDLHIPFTDMSWAHKLIDLEDPDTIVFLGDSIDLHMLSNFDKYKIVDINQEIAIYRDLIDHASRKVGNRGKVYILRGNHEFRWNRYFADRVDPALMSLIPVDVNSVIVNNVRSIDGRISMSPLWNNVEDIRDSEPFWIKIGKAVFIHPSSFKSTPMGTACAQVSSFLHERNQEDVELVIVGHTHQTGEVQFQNKLFWEIGCLCRPMDYEKQGKCTFKSQKLGYAMVCLDAQGRVVERESRKINLGSIFPKKKELPFKVNP